MRKLPWFILSLSLFCLSSGCGSSSGEKKQKEVNTNSLREPLLKANQATIVTEDQQINDFISRYGWKMKETGTGLRYLIYKHGEGTFARKDKIVTLNYEIRLISGDLVYSSKETGPKVFKIGSGGVESGLEEGILFFRVGDKVKMILPSHLAWGLIGDQDRIPPKSTEIYDIEVLSIK
ncbi:MAG: FKBP-type peptidyl-prolyl cis-trans isomerase [Bacteroidetes bacterium]|nr:FKBP-type peptidyl-prolyl cis-trans isomerase [Bacteroidota bacterium]